MFSNLSASSISLATVTPSFVTTGEPKLFSMTTLRPLGPRVTFTAFASRLTPSRIAWRAWCLFLLLSADDGEDFVLAEDHVVDPVELHLGARVLAEQDLVALLHG